MKVGVTVMAALLVGIAGIAMAQGEYTSQPVDVYVQQLQSDDAGVRRRAAYILGRMNAPADVAVPALAEALSDGQMETRWYAMDALGHFGADAAPAVPAIIKSLESKLNDATVRRRAAASLANIGPDAQEAVPILKEALNSDDTLYAIAAAAALWRIEGDPQALTFISEQLQADDAVTAFAAAIALGDLPLNEIPQADEELVPPLVSALGHPNEDVRQATVDALVKVGPPAIEPLSKLLSEERNSETLRGAGVALGMIVDRLRVRKLHNEEIAEADFAAAAGPLIRVAFPALAKGLQSDDPQLRSACQLALAKGGSVASFQLLRILTTDDSHGREAAAQALARMEVYLPRQRPFPPHLQRVHERIIAPLVAAMASEDPNVQRASVRLFVALEVGPAGAAAEPHLRKALETGDLSTRRLADKALQQIQKTDEAN